MKVRLKVSALFAGLLFSSLTFYSVLPNCEAAFAPMRIMQIAALSVPQKCDAGVMDQLCSSITNFLEEEFAKADAEAKTCKKNCNWKKSKDDLINAARKKAKESCARGEAPPDINEVNKGLDGNAKAKLKNLYDNNSRMFDGTAKLDSKDLEPVPSNNAATLTGKGGQVADLKASEPDTPKFNSTTEFSLSGKKLSGETSPASTTKTGALLASAASAKTSGDTTSAPAGKSPTSAPAASAVSAQMQIPVIPNIVIPDIPDPADFANIKDFCALLPGLLTQLESAETSINKSIAQTELACSLMQNAQAQTVCMQGAATMRAALLTISAKKQQIDGYKKNYCGLSWFEGSWFKRNIVLPVISSQLAEWMFPVATRLLNHAKNGEGITWDDQILIADKIKNTEKWQETFMGDANAAEIREKMKGKDLLKIGPGFLFETKDSWDLYFGIHECDVWAKRSGDNILIYIQDDYNFDKGDNYLIRLGKKGMEEGWLTKYNFNVPIMVI